MSDRFRQLAMWFLRDDLGRLKGPFNADQIQEMHSRGEAREHHPVFSMDGTKNRRDGSVCSVGELIGAQSLEQLKIEVQQNDPPQAPDLKEADFQQKTAERITSSQQSLEQLFDAIQRTNENSQSSPVSLPAASNLRRKQPPSSLDEKKKNFVPKRILFPAFLGLFFLGTVYAFIAAFNQNDPLQEQAREDSSSAAVKERREEPSSPRTSSLNSASENTTAAPSRRDFRKVLKERKNQNQARSRQNRPSKKSYSRPTFTKRKERGVKKTENLAPADPRDTIQTNPFDYGIPVDDEPPPPPEPLDDRDRPDHYDDPPPEPAVEPYDEYRDPPPPPEDDYRDEPVYDEPLPPNDDYEADPPPYDEPPLEPIDDY